ncbi:MAG: copper resistance protein B [Burkholderiales bacterium]
MRIVVLGLMLAMGTGSANAQQVDPYPLPPKEWPAPVMDNEPITFLLLDRFEYRAKSGEDAWAWGGQGWWGSYTNKLWLKTEGEGMLRGPAERAEVQALYARRISTYWHVQAGVRHEARPEPSRNTGVIAIEGLAPYWFEVNASAFVGNGLSGRLEAEYDQLLTQRWILQPRAELNFSGSADEERGVRSGLNEVELALRLRYELRREFAPYVGIGWTHRPGEGSDTALVLGVRVWY